MTNHSTAYFVLEDNIYIGQDPSRGPWSPDHCHAGPVAGAIARTVEHLVGADKDLVRLTIDLLRPIPMRGFRIEAEITRDGRSVATATAALTDLDGRVCATATSMHITPQQFPNMPTAPTPPLPRTEALPGSFPLSQALHQLPAFGHFVEVAYPPGETKEPGPTTLWMKTPPLLPTETPSPFQSLCPLADCGNAFSRLADPDEVSFINPDLTIVAHRKPTSQWLASSSNAHWQTTGIGLATAVIQDEDGPVATALQSLILRPAE